MVFQYYIDNVRNWRWRLKAANGRILADSGEGYVRKEDCLQAINLVKQLAALAPVQQG